MWVALLKKLIISDISKIDTKLSVFIRIIAWGRTGTSKGVYVIKDLVKWKL